jgi:hypothetical protein
MDAFLRAAIDEARQGLARVSPIGSVWSSTDVSSAAGTTALQQGSDPPAEMDCVRRGTAEGRGLSTVDALRPLAVRHVQLRRLYVTAIVIGENRTFRGRRTLSLVASG